MNTTTFPEASASLVYTLFGLIRALVIWAAMAFVMTSGVAIVAFIAIDLSAFTQGQLREWLRFVVMVSGVVSAGWWLLGNVLRFWVSMPQKGQEHFSSMGAADARAFPGSVGE